MTFTSAAEIRVFLAFHLPMYSKADDDDDEFVFIATAADVEQLAMDLWEYIATDGDAE